MSEETAIGPKNENDKPSFGRYLQEARLNKGKSLGEISEETRIARHVLKFIESEDLSELPDPLYVKSFLQCYADAVGADRDYTVQSYLTKANGIHSTLQADPEHTGASAKIWSWLLLFLGILGCLIIASVFLISPIKDHHLKSQDKSPSDVHVEEQPKTAESTDQMNVSDVEVTAEKKSASGPGKMMLIVETIEETWMKIIIDHQESKEFNLKPEDRLEFEGTQDFNLLLGNAGGVRLFLDDEPVSVKGKTGQVVNIQLP